DCDPSGASEEHWTKAVELTPPEGRAPDGYGVVAIDGLGEKITRDDLQRGYHDIECARDHEVLRCLIHAKPWRTYAVVPVTRDLDFAGQPIVMGFYQS